MGPWTEGFCKWAYRFLAVVSISSAPSNGSMPRLSESSESDSRILGLFLCLDLATCNDSDPELKKVLELIYKMLVRIIDYNLFNHKYVLILLELTSNSSNRSQGRRNRPSRGFPSNFQIQKAYHASTLVTVSKDLL